MANAIWAYIELVRECRPFEDVLIWVHTELLATKRGEGLGQFFTPPDLVELQVALSRDFKASGVDMDPFCVAMTALQLQAAQVLHSSPLKHVELWVGNTLAGRRKLGYITHRWKLTIEELLAKGAEIRGELSI